MNRRILIPLVVLILTSTGFIIFWKRDKIVGMLDVRHGEVKEAFDTAALSPEVTRDIALEVTLVSPNAVDTPEVRQVTITFNKPMVPLGDFEKLAQGMPIHLLPEAPCHWRWLNRMTLACELDQALPGSTAYSLTIDAGLKAFDGSSLTKPFSSAFSTQFWKVVASPVEWRGPDVPEVFWTFSQPMILSSLQEKTTSDCGPLTISTVDAKATENLELDSSRTYRLAFAQPLGLNRTCNLTLAADAKSSEGPEKGREFRQTFKTYPEFYLSTVRCQYANAINGPFPKVAKIEGCDPDASVSIQFSSPLYAKSLARKIEVKPFFGWSPGGEGSPEYFEQNPDELLQAITLRGPLHGRATHTVEFGEIKDRWDRPLTKAKQITIQTIDFPAIMMVQEGFGVLERKSLAQIAYTSVNISKFRLQTLTGKKADDIDLWKGFAKAYEQCQGKVEAEFAQKHPFRTHAVDTKAALNTPETRPLDLRTFEPDFQYGMYLGRADSFATMGESVRASSAERCHNFFLVTTDLGITAKVGFYDSGVWIHSIDGARPLSGVRVSLRDYKNVLTQGVTDANGFAALDGAIKWDPERDQYGGWGDKMLFVVAETKDDFSVLPFSVGQRGINYYDFSNYEAGLSFSDYKLTASRNHIVHAITDRPLYQPNQEVNLKIFARHWEPRTFGLKPALEMDLKVRDSLGKDVFREKIKLSEFGTASAKLKLDPACTLGTYSIEVQIDKFVGYAGTFDVQEFTLPSFKVTVEASKPRYSVAEAPGFKARALYHFGGGVANTKGQFSATFEESRWQPKTPAWERFTFDNPVALHLKGYEQVRPLETITVRQGMLETDRNGEALQSLLLPAQQIHSYGILRFEAKFNDDRGKTIAGRASVPVSYSAFELGLAKPKWVYEAQKEIVPDVILLDPDEKPVDNAKVTLKLIYRRYDTVRVHGSGNYFSYQSSVKDQVVDTCMFTSGSSPKGCALKSKAAGSHFILAEARDSRNRLAQSSLALYVTGKEYVGWYRENHDRLDIIPDKKSYTLGDTVQVLVKNPYPKVDALFTLERFGILKQFRKTLTQGSEIVKIPIDSKDYAPGFYLSVQLLKGRASDKIEGEVDLGKPSFKMGLTKITVVNPDTLLAIKADADRADVQPGEEVQVSLAIRSPSGSNQTELSVAVVDEKILQLAGAYEEKYNLHDRFYQFPFGDVTTSQMLSFLIGRRHFGKKGVSAGGDGGFDQDVRKNFLPLAYWNPTLLTDGSGRASVSFKTPDNLTTWRVLVVAVDKEHRFGFGSTTFRVNKKVMLEPALPSFLTEGDELNARMVVFNRSGERATIEGNLDLTGASLQSPASVKVDVDDNGKGYLDWKVSAPTDSKSATFKVRAEASRGKDAALYTVPIRPFTSFETFANYGSTTEGGVTEPLQIPAKIRANLGGVDVILSSSLISHLDDVFRYVFDYPYACWEQTFTRALVLNQYSQVRPYLSLPELNRNPEEWIQELLAVMPKHQGPNGGMGYWLNDPRTIDPYLSTFTSLGLLWLNESKTPIPREPSERVFKYARGLLAGAIPFPRGYSPSMKATTLSMAVYVTTVLGDKNVASINKLFEERKNLSLFGKSFLWMAARRHAEIPNVAATLRGEIFSMANMTSGSIQFQEKVDDGFQRILHSTVRTNCNLLTAILEDDSKAPFVEPLVRWIIGARKANHWNNTQENLYCLNALIHYAKIYESEKPAFTVTGQVLSEELKAATYKDFKDPPQTQHFSFKPENVGKASSLLLNKKGDGRLYYTARLRIAYEDVRTDEVNSGMQVSRTYFLKNAQGKWQAQPGDLHLKRGDLVRIQLRVKIPASRMQVALADALPAGLEPLNTSLATTAQSDAADQKDNSAGEYDWNEDDNWWGFYSSGGFYHREVRLTGMQYFADFLDPGSFEMNYIAQAIATGTFQANPAVIEQMYEPEVYGKSTPGRFVIEN